MSNNLVEVNLKALGGKVFVGRKNGQAARKHFHLERYNESRNTLIFLVPPGTISINSSFFLGLFGPDIQRIASYRKFFEYVDITRVEDRHKVQLELAVKRSLSDSSYGL